MFSWGKGVAGARHPMFQKVPTSGYEMSSPPYRENVLSLGNKKVHHVIQFMFSELLVAIHMLYPVLLHRQELLFIFVLLFEGHKHYIVVDYYKK